MQPREPKQPAGDGKGVSPRLVAAAVLAVLALVFVFQNNDKHSVQFLFVDVNVRTWVALLVSLLVGFVIGWLVRGSRQKK